MKCCGRGKSYSYNRKPDERRYLVARLKEDRKILFQYMNSTMLNFIITNSKYKVKLATWASKYGICALSCLMRASVLRVRTPSRALERCLPRSLEAWSNRINGSSIDVMHTSN